MNIKVTAFTESKTLYYTYVLFPQIKQSKDIKNL